MTRYRKILRRPCPAFSLGDLIIGVNNQRVMTIVELRKIIDGKPSVLALNILRGDDNIYLLLNNAGR